jgi:extracellular factor (EF) 3-hydroxypalmitic acid methyl ester biosynthesis protein
MTILDTAGYEYISAQPERVADAIPDALTRAVQDFKAAMLAADRLIITGRGTESEIQALIDQACVTLAGHLRAHVEAGSTEPDAVGAFVHQETYPYLGMSTLIDRSYTKPRGYAGDYLTLQMVYDDQPDGVRRLGPFIDRWFLGMPAARAVKNRRQLLRDIIIDAATVNGGNRLAVTSLACGPAREIFDVFGAPDHPDIGVTCVDIDDQALCYAQGIAAETGAIDRVTFLQGNIVKAALGREHLEVGPQDLVYSIGLIDYLKDRLVVKLLDWMYHRLKPGGAAIVGNFDIANPDKAFMDHVLDWKLIHRSADDLVGLFGQSRFGKAPVEVRCEDTGINLFAIAQRTS